LKSNSILVAAGLGVIAAIAFLYFAPKVKPKTVTTVQKKQKIMEGVVYPPPQVNFPNNATKPIQKDYLGMDFAGATFRR
jgi:hypothetical protein